MPVNELIMSGLTLMFFGMGIVFGFLLMLVFVMKGMSKIVHILASEELPPTTMASPLVMPQSGHIRPQVISVISAAIRQYRTS